MCKSHHHIKQAGCHRPNDDRELAAGDAAVGAGKRRNKRTRGAGARVGCLVKHCLHWW